MIKPFNLLKLFLFNEKIINCSIFFESLFMFNLKVVRQLELTSVETAAPDSKL